MGRQQFRRSTPERQSPKTEKELRGIADQRISINRLRVPAKARKLYEEAMDAWQKQEPDEAQPKLDQALKIYPGVPEGLALNGFVQASRQDCARILLEQLDTLAR